MLHAGSKRIVIQKQCPVTIHTHYRDSIAVASLSVCRVARGGDMVEQVKGLRLPIWVRGVEWKQKMIVTSKSAILYEYTVYVHRKVGRDGLAGQYVHF